MTFVPLIVVVASLEPPDGASVATGSVTFDLTGRVRDTANDRLIPAKTVEVQLDANGNLAQELEPNDFPGAEPPNSQYWTTLQVDGAPPVTGYITVPTSPPGSRLVTDGVVTAGSQVLTSASAAFTNVDVGKYVWGLGLPSYTQILSVTNGTTVTLSTGASASAGPGDLLIGAQADLLSLLGG